MSDTGEAKAFNDVSNGKAPNLATTEIKAVVLLGGSDNQKTAKTDVALNQLGRQR